MQKRSAHYNRNSGLKTNYYVDGNTVRRLEGEPEERRPAAKRTGSDQETTPPGSKTKSGTRHEHESRNGVFLCDGSSFDQRRMRCLYQAAVGYRKQNKDHIKTGESDYKFKSGK